MRYLSIIGLLVAAGCAGPEPYGAAPALSPVSSNLSTMRQITGRAERLETLRPEPGDIWAAGHPSDPPPALPRRPRTAAPRGEAFLAPPPLNHAEGDFWRMP